MMTERLLNVYVMLSHDRFISDKAELQRYYLYNFHYVTLSLSLLNRYVHAFSHVYWPFLPFHWSIVDPETVQDFISRGELEKDVLTLNLMVATYSGMSLLPPPPPPHNTHTHTIHTYIHTHFPPPGATNQGNFKLGKELYMMCRSMVEDLHAEMDMNIVIPLIFLSANAFSFLDGQTASKLATTYMMIAKTICELNRATDTEVIFLPLLTSSQSLTPIFFFFTKYRHITM